MSLIEENFNKIIARYELMKSLAQEDKWEEFESHYKECQVLEKDLSASKLMSVKDAQVKLDGLRQTISEIYQLAEKRRDLLGKAITMLNQGHKANRVYEQAKHVKD